jgi:hypothetical protein
MEIGFTNLQQPLGFRTGFVAAEIWPVASHATNEGFWNGAEWRLCGQSNGSKLMFQFRLYPLNRGWHGVRSQRHLPQHLSKK